MCSKYLPGTLPSEKTFLLLFLLPLLLFLAAVFMLVDSVACNAKHSDARHCPARYAM